MNTDFEIFPGKTFADACKDVYDRSQSKKDQLDTLISDVRTLIKDKNDAQSFLPRIKELMEVGVKNDDQLVKLVGICQKAQSTQLEPETSELTDEDKEQLLQARIRELEEIQKEVNSPISSSISKY